MAPGNVDKALKGNKNIFDKIEKYSSRRDRSNKRLSNIEIPVVTGGYKTSKISKTSKTSKTSKISKTSKRNKTIKK